MRREGLIAWLLVAAALAVPSGSLYFWLTATVDAAYHREQTVRRQRDTPIFVVPHLRKPLINPTARKPEVRIHEEDLPVQPPPQAEIPEKPQPAPEFAAQAPKPAPAAWTSPRDPMLSPSEEAILNAPIPDVDAPAPAPRRVARSKPIQDTVNVEAIIALEGISSAIVNGIAVKVGDMVGRVKVVLITPERVTFSYRNLRFVKSI